MESKAKILGHPIHQTLIVFPVGLLATSFIFDCILLYTGDQTYAVPAFWMISAGLIGGAIAAIFGIIDWLAIPQRTRAKSIGAAHGLGNVVLLALFFASHAIRRNEAELVPTFTAILLSGVAIVLLLITGWLGGELVSRLGVGVHDNANLDAPNSITGRAAHE